MKGPEADEQAQNLEACAREPIHVPGAIQPSTSAPPRLPTSARSPNSSAAHPTSSRPADGPPARSDADPAQQQPPPGREPSRTYSSPMRSASPSGRTLAMGNCSVWSKAARSRSRPIREAVQRAALPQRRLHRRHDAPVSLQEPHVGLPSPEIEAPEGGIDTGVGRGGPGLHDRMRRQGGGHPSRTNPKDLLIQMYDTPFQRPFAPAPGESRT